jgi:bla regulator protein blaR1
MEAASLFTTSTYTEAIAFTLLHSLWQSLLALLLAKGVLMFVPSRRADIKYAVNGIALVLFFCSTVFTFFLISAKTGTEAIAPFTLSLEMTQSSVPPMTEWSAILSQQLQHFANYIIAGWALGTLIFLLRLTGSWVYVYRLCSKALVVHSPLQAKLHSLKAKLKINWDVTLLESPSISIPVVIGIIKPVIVIPIGLASGLSNEQIETIFIHELVHIKRHDYIINLLQTIIEAVFFFNPFMWILSDSMRTEREHICDDAVVSNGGDTKAYVYALAALEEARVENHGLALSILGNKNELLKRIQRLMEKSAKNYSTREKIVPVVLLITGLMCASWFSINKSADSQSYTTADQQTFAADTTIKKKNKNRNSKTLEVPPPTIEAIPADEAEPAEPMEELDIYVGDFPMVPMPEIGIDMDLMPVMEMPSIEMDMMLELDSLPSGRFNRNWDEFEKEFEERFKEKFGDFYKKHQGEFQKMMEEFEGRYNDRFTQWSPEHEVEALAHAQVAREHAQHARRQHELSMVEQERHMKEMDENMQRWERDHADHMKVVEEDMRKVDAEMKEMEKNMHAFEIELKKELVKDGYLKADEEVKTINWDGENEMRVNGKKIKDSDSRKYSELQEKFLKKQNVNIKHSE